MKSLDKKILSGFRSLMSNGWKGRGCNIRVFHSTTVIQRRRNFVEKLKDDNGNWIEEQSILQQLARSFNINLYTDNNPPLLYKYTFNFPKLTRLMLGSSTDQ